MNQAVFYTMSLNFHCVHSLHMPDTGWPSPPQKKTEPIYFWLKFINLILAFSFFFKIWSRLCAWDHSIHQHILVNQGNELELFCFIFVEVIKKLYGFYFWWSPCIKRSRIILPFRWSEPHFPASEVMFVKKERNVSPSVWSLLLKM